MRQIYKVAGAALMAISVGTAAHAAQVGYRFMEGRYTTTETLSEIVDYVEERTMLTALDTGPREACHKGHPSTGMQVYVAHAGEVAFRDESGLLTGGHEIRFDIAALTGGDAAGLSCDGAGEELIAASALGPCRLGHPSGGMQAYVALAAQNAFRDINGRITGGHAIRFDLPTLVGINTVGAIPCEPEFPLDRAQIFAAGEDFFESIDPADPTLVQIAPKSDPVADAVRGALGLSAPGALVAALTGNGRSGGTAEEPEAPGEPEEIASVFDEDYVPDAGPGAGSGFLPQIAPVPLPAGAVLLLAGLGALGGARALRRT